MTARRPPERGQRHQAVLFDVFGTLVEYQPDRARLQYPATHALLGGWGHALAHDDFVAAWDAASAELEVEAEASSVEFSMLDAASAFCRHVGIHLPREGCQQLGDTFVAEWQVHVRVIPGAAEMLERLAASVRLGIVSNTHDPAMVPALLDAMGVAEHVEVVVLSVDHGFRKPHPSIYQAALTALGAAPDQVSFVGDSFEADYVGPIAAGMDAFLIDPDGRHDVPSAARLSSVLDIEALVSGRRDH